MNSVDYNNNSYFNKTYKQFKILFHMFLEIIVDLLVLVIKNISFKSNHII